MQCMHLNTQDCDGSTLIHSIVWLVWYSQRTLNIAEDEADYGGAGFSMLWENIGRQAGRQLV